jgi:Flp pilus assembly protein TadG
MNVSSTPVKQSGFLARLRADESGNIVAMTAAAVLPVIAMVGGAIDMSRLYGVQTRIQAACDAGALTGRRVMGSGAWETAAEIAAEQNGAAENAANAMFATNFASNFFGATNLSRDFSGSDGRVTGTVSVDVPMTLMRVFGQESRTVSVTCTSEMRIPHTDVMFVLDTTGSMNCAPGDTVDGANSTTVCSNNGGVEKSNSRMKGLRTAVNCFYESLAKRDSGEVCDAVNGDPTPTGLASGIQLRFGFMPYSSNINVGKLLPTSYFEDNWTYQSRSPIISTINVWNDNGSEVPDASYSAWSPTTRPSSGNHTSAANYSTTWTSTTGTGTTSVPQLGGTAITLNNTVAMTDNSLADATECTNQNTLDSKKMRAIGDTAGSAGSDVGGAYSAPTHPATQKTRTLTQTRRNTVTAYRYSLVGTTCRLQSSPGKTSSSDTRWDQSHTRTGRTPIAWTTARELTGWTLQPRSVSIGGLKNGTNWNSSFTVDDFSTTTQTVNKSGSNTSSNIYTPAPATLSWGGCIEERQTYKNIDSDPSDEWNPIPSTAFDMDIDMVPSATANTKWAPAIQDLIYGRYSGSSRTTSNTTTAVVSGSNFNISRLNNSLACPDEAKKLAVFTNGADIKTYTDGLTPNGGTYHDIGLLWGARFMSPTGIFGAANSNDSNGNPITIQRHMVFMTDGDTGTCSGSYTPYGVSWWDRRQTNKANPDDDTGLTYCRNSYTNGIVDARTVALCNAIKNMNITLWVVSFSAGVNATTETRLQNCASSTSHFYDADSSADLRTAFDEIALQISRLRLQS